MIRKGLVLGVAELLLVALGQSNAAGTGSIQMVVVDPNGNPLPYVLTELRNSDSKRSSLLTHCRTLTCTNLPFGTYQYILARSDVTNPGVSQITGKIVVRLPEEHITLTPRGDFGLLPNGVETIIDYGPRQGEMSGRVVGLVPNTNSWIKLVNPFTEELIEVSIHKDGMFRILEPPYSGVYIMVVISNGKIVGSQTIQFKDPADRNPILVDVTTHPK